MLLSRVRVLSRRLCSSSFAAKIRPFESFRKSTSPVFSRPECAGCFQAAFDVTLVMENIGPGPIATDDRTLPTVCHLLGLAGLTGIPLANVLAPLGLWLWKREGNPLLDAHGKEVLNFQISFSIYLALAALTFFIFIGFFVFSLVLLAHIILTVIGSVKAS